MLICKDTKVRKRSAMKKKLYFSALNIHFEKRHYNSILNHQTPEKYLCLITKYSYQRDSLYNAMKYVTLFVSYFF